MITVRRGETLSWDGQISTSLVGWSATSKARAGIDDNESVATLTVTILAGTTGLFTISATAAQTATWPLGPLVVDVRFVDGAGVVSFTDPIRIAVVNPATR